MFPNVNNFVPQFPVVHCTGINLMELGHYWEDYLHITYRLRLHHREINDCQNGAFACIVKAGAFIYLL